MFPTSRYKFLFEYCGCNDEKANSNYVDMLPPRVWPPEATKKYLDWMDSDRSNSKKAEKSIMISLLMD